MRWERSTEVCTHFFKDVMKKITQETLTLAEITEVENALPLVESISKVISQEEILAYSKLTNEYLLANKEIPQATKVAALTCLKTLSHLSQKREVLSQQAKALPLAKNRSIYYQVPFLPELTVTSDLLGWYQQEAKWVLSQKNPKGDYSALTLMIYFYESVVFHVATNKKQGKQFYAIAEVIFKKIVGSFQELNQAFQKQDDSHQWFSSKTANDYKKVAGLWKETVDVTTIRHVQRLPASFRRPMEKLPVEWAELLKITHHGKVSMLNVIYLLKCLESDCRETRSYSAFLLHFVCEDRPGFLESLAHTRVNKSFLNRLRIAYRLKEDYPKLPEELPDKFQREVFLLLIEYGINSLAKIHKVKEKGGDSLAEKFREFDEQVQAKKEVVVTGPEIEVAPLKPPKKETAPREFTSLQLPKKKEDENKEAANNGQEGGTSQKEEMEFKFEPISDDMEFGMGIQTMPYVFPFTYQDDQGEIPLQHFPDIKWQQLEWSDMQAGGVHIYTGITRLFIKKLETVETYRYSIYSPEEIQDVKPAPNYFCFIVREGEGEDTKYYVVAKKSGLVKGKDMVWIEITLSAHFLKKINQAYFLILPKPYEEHILAIPR